MSAQATRQIWKVAVGLAVVAVTAAVAIAVVTERPAPARAQLTLTVPGGASADCNAFDENVLAGMPTAFAGTVSSVSDATVEIDVDRRFRGVGSDVSTVRFTTEPDAPVAIEDAIALEAGTRYLVSATDGVVNVWCGYTAKATPELERSFERAFGD